MCSLGNHCRINSKSLRGVADAGVNFASRNAWVQYDASVTKVAHIQNAVGSIGYDLIGTSSLSLAPLLLSIKPPGTAV